MNDIAARTEPSGASEGFAGRRLDVLRVVRSADAPVSIAQIAAELAIHPNTVRFHLGSLVDEGRIEHAEPDHKGPGRPALMFRAIRQMDPAGPRRFRLLAEILTLGLADDTDPRGKALAAGRAWASRLSSPDRHSAPADPGESASRLAEMLDEMGFQPQNLQPDAAGGGQLGLRHCPFLELAETAAEVVCPLHLGLMQGALQAWDAPVTVDRLDAFAEPDLCIAHLTPVSCQAHRPDVLATARTVGPASPR